ncbi:hypothetical protein FKM82_029399 [Ascaphus truei]
MLLIARFFNNTVSVAVQNACPTKHIISHSYMNIHTFSNLSTILLNNFNNIYSYCTIQSFFNFRMLLFFFFNSV